MSKCDGVTCLQPSTEQQTRVLLQDCTCCKAPPDWTDMDFDALNERYGFHAQGADFMQFH